MRESWRAWQGRDQVVARLEPKFQIDMGKKIYEYDASLYQSNSTHSTPDVDLGLEWYRRDLNEINRMVFFF